MLSMAFLFLEALIEASPPLFCVVPMLVLEAARRLAYVECDRGT